ncbi:hypothetical protein NMY22_g16327 [Coprinellus aureogranulatus]|nr:hypothetical protein NMY22_g16327 [Coprinellus aureogranulatus]
MSLARPFCTTGWQCSATNRPCNSNVAQRAELAFTSRSIKGRRGGSYLTLSLRLLLVFSHSILKAVKGRLEARRQVARRARSKQWDKASGSANKPAHGFHRLCTSSPFAIDATIRLASLSSRSLSVFLAGIMCMPPLVLRIFKRNREKSKDVVFDVYERDIIESPRTPPESFKALQYSATRAHSSNAPCIGSESDPASDSNPTTRDSSRARYGGNGESREGNFLPECPSVHYSSDGPRHLAAFKRTPSFLAAQARMARRKFPVPPPTPPKSRRVSCPPQAEHVASHHPDASTQDAILRQIDLNARPLPPLPGSRTRSITFASRGNRFEADIKEGDPATRPQPKTESSFEIPCSWEELAKLSSRTNSPRLEDADDWAVAAGVQAMIALVSSPTSSGATLPLEGNATAKDNGTSGNSPRVLESRDSFSFGTTPSTEKHSQIPFPSREEIGVPFPTTHSPVRSHSSKSTQDQFTPRARRRTDSSVYPVTPTKTRFARPSECVAVRC